MRRRFLRFFWYDTHEYFIRKSAAIRSFFLSPSPGRPFVFRMSPRSVVLWPAPRSILSVRSGGSGDRWYPPPLPPHGSGAVPPADAVHAAPPLRHRGRVPLSPPGDGGEGWDRSSGDAGIKGREVSVRCWGNRFGKYPSGCPHDPPPPSGDRPPPSPLWFPAGVLT